MRLLQHNVLKCNAKGVRTGFPLQIEVEEMEVVTTDCNFGFMKDVLRTLHWPGVVVAANAIGLSDIPQVWNDNLLDDEQFVLAMHNLLIDVNIIKGTLICPETNTQFPIEGGIPNMK